MKQRKFYVVYYVEKEDKPRPLIVKLNTREYGKTEKLIDEIVREIRRQLRLNQGTEVSLLNLMELDN